MTAPIDDDERQYLRAVLRDPKTADLLSRCFEELTDTLKNQLVVEADLTRMQRIQAEVKGVTAVQLKLHEWAETKEEREAHRDAHKPRTGL